MDLSTPYLGLSLRNPIIASASPLTGDVGVIRQLEDSGAGAVVLPSLFEEQIQEEERLIEILTSVGADSSPEAGSYFPAAVAYNSGPSGYLDLVARARAAVDIPVIASLNGTHAAGWVDCAQLIEQAAPRQTAWRLSKLSAAGWRSPWLSNYIPTSPPSARWPGSSIWPEPTG